MLSRAPTGSKDIWDHWVSVIRGQEKVPALISLLKEAIMTKDVSDPEEVKIKPDTELGSFENPLPITLTQPTEVLDEQLTDGPLREVRNWLIAERRPHSSEASCMDKTTRAYYSKFSRLVITRENLVALKYWGEACQKFRLLVCIPDKQMLKCIQLQHDHNGHPGVEKTIRMLLQTVWWP